MRKLFLLLTILILCTVDVYAAHKIVHTAVVGGTGTGADYTNAYDTLQEGLNGVSRGDTVFVDGLENVTTQIGFNKAVSGTDTIFVIAPLPHLCSMIPGWDDSFSSGYTAYSAQVPMNAIFFVSTSYYKIDGITGCTPDSLKLAVKRIKVAWSDSTNNVNPCMRLYDCDNIFVRGVDFQHAGMDNWEAAEDGYLNSQDCIYNSGTPTGITFQYCRFTNANRTHILFGNVTNTTLEYNYFYGRHGAPHGESISWTSNDAAANNVIRYNVFEDISGTGIIVLVSGTHGGWEIYGNSFFTHDPTKFYTTNGYICNTSSATSSNMEVYNNTFYNLTSGVAGAISWRGEGTGNISRNNLFYSCGPAILWAGAADDLMTISNNASDEAADSCYIFLSGDPFTSVVEGNEDFTPVAGYAGKDVGTDLSPIFTLDLAGNVYGADGYWDVGAYEEQSAYIIVTSPNSGETWTVGTSHNITWTSSGVTTVGIELTYNDGVTYIPVHAGVSAALGTYSWTVVDLPSTLCRIRITDTGDAEVTDSSNALFTIVAVVIPEPEPEPEPEPTPTPSTGDDPMSVGLVTLTITAGLGTGYAAYRRYRGTHRR